MNTRGQNILNKIGTFLSQRIVYHSILWMSYILILSLIQYNSFDYSFGFFFSNELIKTAFYAAGVYFNIFYLIPNYLSNKKFLIYCSLLILAVIIITPLKVLFLFLKASDFPEYQLSLK